MKHIPKKRIDPGIPLGTVGEFKMLGLRLPAQIANSNQLSESDVIKMPASAAIKVVFALFEQWDIPAHIQSQILGVTRNTYSKYERGGFPTRKAQLLRIEDLLAIYKALMVLFPEQGDSVLRWLRVKNEILMGKTPLKLMSADGLRKVRLYLEGQLLG